MPRPPSLSTASPISTTRSDSRDCCSESEEEGNEDYRKGGYHAVRIGENFKGGRYVVKRKLGWGHFSTVWLAWDYAESRFVALKVQKSAQHYTEAAIDEVTILKQIAAEDPDDSKGVVKLLDHFKHTGPNGQHVCMVFEFLGDNLLTLIKLYKYRGLPLHMVKELASQILVGLDYLHRQLSIIHTDLKPENILLVSPLDPDKDPRKSALLEDIPFSGDKHGSDSSSAVGDGYKETTSLTKNKKKKLKRRARKAGNNGNGNGNVNANGNGNFNGNGNAHQGGNQTTQKAQPINSNTVVGSTDGIVENSSVKSLRNVRPVSENADVVPGSSTLSDPSIGEVAGSSPQSRQSSSGLQLTRADEGHIEATRSETHLGQAHQTRDGINLKCKIVDLGNACWSYNQFTSDIQTRQYRCPEAVLGAKYSHPADMWSFACIIFELATGDVLFDPRSGDDFDRDEDHLALMMELMGRMPRKTALGGKYSRDYFNRHGELRHIRKLRYWPLDRVLAEKYGFNVDDAQQLANFLRPFLDFSPERRPTAGQCLSHPWLKNTPATLSLPLQPALEAERGVVTAPVDINSEGVHASEAMERAEVAMGNIAIRGPELWRGL
ncbi:unnamed protein product [Calypogeia fissa]